MLKISAGTGQVLPLQGTAEGEDDTLPMDRHCLLAGDYYFTTLLVQSCGSALFLTPGKAIRVAFG